MSFVHLHVHSEYSLLDGFSNIKKIVKRAREMGMPALALTDHGTMFGVIDFYKAATNAGIKPIIGVEAYLAARGMRERDPQQDKRSSHLLLLAENETGYRNLLKIASAAQMEGFYYFPRIDHEFLASHSEGLICTSGCMSAEIPRLIQQENLEAARRQMDWYFEVFGPDHFFLELQQHDIQELDRINKMLLDLGRRYEARFVATNDVHYINAEDARLQDIMLAIQTGCVLSDPNRMRMSDNTYYLRSPDEMASIFSQVPEAITNTLLIAERCNLDLGFKGYHLPEFDVPPGYTPASYLRELCEAGLDRRYGSHSQDAEVRQRLDYELGIIHQMGFDTYFLIVWDLCRYAREQSIWYNARGSAAGSIVAYTLDITLVDPIQHGLIFERFLNPGRISMPDIDLDFRDDMRAQMLEYTARKYGDDKVAQIITFGTLGARAAIRDVGRVMDIPLAEVDKAAKMIPAIPGKPVSIPEALQGVPDFKNLYQSAPYFRDLIDTARHMEGVVRNAGTHAAGVIVADKPIIDYLPLHRPTGSSSEDSPIKTVTQFEMTHMDSLGLLKIDFLGLATLTIMARACDLIKARHGLDLNLDNIPIDDPATYELLGRGETAGVFQVEGSGMRRYLMQMKPRTLDNVIAMVALFRPGPMEFIPGYIRRMHGEEKIEYRHPALEPIFKETYGYPVYQEQLMFAVMKLAGYSAPEADELRGAISKKQKEKLLKHREKFIAGAVKSGIPEETAKAIFDDWEEFARYGFNKCLPGDTEIVDPASGRLVKIEDLYTGKVRLEETLTCDIQSLTVESGQISEVWFNGNKPVFRLTTALGRTIEATSNHPFLIYKGWQKLEDLKIGDMIAVPRSIPVQGFEEWPEHEVIALGHLLAEGNLCHPHSVYYYSQDMDLVEDFVRSAEAFDNVSCSVSKHKGTFSVYARRVIRERIPGIVHWARKIGIWGKKAREKEIPAVAFELTNRQIGLLISRMWEGDGHIDRQGQSLFYATHSERLARQLQHLLLRLGIISRLRVVVFPYKEGRTGYQLFITRQENIRQFKNLVGIHFVCRKHREELKELVQDNLGLSTKDVVPLEVKQLVRIAKERSGLTWAQINETCGVAQREFYPLNSKGKSGFTRSTIGRLASFFDDPELFRFAENDIYWDRITSIEFSGMKPTYDLEVSGNHNFVANDILVHNSHAVDYGVLAVQTAYLKSHYPVEYMTALLSVTQHNTDKVALYAADCRRMGIEVAPPDVNSSGWDFTIEDHPDGKSTIRFGLGAVKNVGHGPVGEILQARDKGGRFPDINDFAHRVDLRHVGKRSLECLVRVGAFDRFGSRPALLQSIDRLVSVSASHFRAAEMGQMSMFGPHTGIQDEITLPDYAGEISRREQLDWERELIGLYISDHPLSQVMEVLTEIVTHFSGQLSEVGPNDRVRVAGLITRIRGHVTKTGKSMGFVTIEDLQGAVELLIFPRTWEQVSELIEFDKIIMAEGRVDAQGNEPKILVDNITTNLSLTTAAGTAPANPLPIPPLVDPGPPEEFEAWEPEGPELEIRERGWYPDEEAEADSQETAAIVLAAEGNHLVQASSNKVPDGENLASEEIESQEDLQPPADWTAPKPPESSSAEAFEDDEDIPPPPDLFPVDWEMANAVMAAVADPAVSKVLANVPLAPEAGDREAEPPVNDSPAVQAVGENSPARSPGEATPPPASVESPAYIIPPLPSTEGESVYMVTIQLRPSEDKVRDNIRIRQIYGTLITYPGKDRFAFHLFERGRGYLIEFPNFTTGLCPELINRLKAFIPAEQVHIEPITFQ